MELFIIYRSQGESFFKKSPWKRNNKFTIFQSISVVERESIAMMDGKPGGEKPLRGEETQKDK